LQRSARCGPKNITAGEMAARGFQRRTTVKRRFRHVDWSRRPHYRCRICRSRFELGFAAEHLELAVHAEGLVRA
jgi:hypothetical protein